MTHSLSILLRNSMHNLAHIVGLLSFIVTLRVGFRNRANIDLSADFVSN